MDVNSYFCRVLVCRFGSLHRRTYSSHQDISHKSKLVVGCLSLCFILGFRHMAMVCQTNVGGYHEDRIWMVAYNYSDYRFNYSFLHVC